MEGNCNCEKITVHINDPDLFTRRRGHICRCINCKKTAGSICAANLIIEEKVEVIGEENLTKYTDPRTGSRKPLGSTCGNPIMSITPNIPGKRIIKLGIFEKLPEPEWESFSSSRQSWEKPLEGAIQYKTKTGGEKM